MTKRKSEATSEKQIITIESCDEESSSVGGPPLESIVLDDLESENDRSATASTLICETGNEDSPAIVVSDSESGGRSAL